MIFLLLVLNNDSHITLLADTEKL